MKRVLVLAVAVLAVAGIVFYFMSRETDEEAIRRIVRQTTQSFIAEDLGGSFASVSSEYSDRFGFDRWTLGRMIANVFHAYEDLSVEVSIESITVRDREAILVAGILVQGNAGGQAVPLFADGDKPRRMLFTFAKGFRGGWKLIKSELDLSQPMLATESTDSTDSASLTSVVLRSNFLFFWQDFLIPKYADGSPEPSA